MAQAKQVLSWLFAMCCVLAVAGTGALFWAKGQFEAPGPLEAEAIVVIPSGSGVQKIAAILSEAGVLDRPEIFTYGAKLTDRAGSLKAGEFRFPAYVSADEAIDILVDGKAVLRRLTIPEGLSSVEIVELINATEGLEGEITTIPPEGSLLPETYLFSRNEDRAVMIQRMSTAMTATLSELWEMREEGLPLETPEEAVILASLVQKESFLVDEQPVVAGVFTNRLRKGMRLQSDPTVIYGITLGKPLGRRLLRKDLRAETDWNTYRIGGLPPTPIANPGRSALQAVLSPAETDYIYFVADGTGGHAFARTLDEHNRNVRQWRKIRDKK